MQRLSPTDLAYLKIEPQSLAVTVLRFGPRADGSRPTAEEIITYAEETLLDPGAPPVVAAFRQRLRMVPGNLARPFREDDPGFDVRRHVVRHPAPEPVPVSSIAGLVCDAMSRPFDLHHPLWRLEIIEEFDDGSFGLVVSCHHAIADGQAAYLVLAALALSFTPEMPEHGSGGRRWSPGPATSETRAVTSALTDRLSWLRGVPANVRGAAASEDLSTVAARVSRLASYVEHQPPPNERPPRLQTMAGRRDWRLHRFRFQLFDLRMASRGLGVTINELLLAAVGAAWTVVEPEAREVWVLVPVNVRQRGEVTATNALAFAVVAVPCGRDLLETLRGARESSTRVKDEGQARTLDELGRFLAHLPRAARRTHWGRIDRPDVVLSNLPGFPLPVYCHGGRLVDALASTSLPEEHWSKFHFVTFEDDVFGTMIEDGRAGATGRTFAAVFEEAVMRLCRMGADRALLARQPQVSALSPAEVDTLARSMVEMSVDPGTKIVTAGDPADAFYVIRSGSASVEVDQGVGRNLGPGSSFGEVGLLSDGRRSATVVALSSMDLLRIDRESFLSVLGGDRLNILPVEAVIREYAAVRR